MRKRADGIVPLCDLAAREKTSVSGVVEELLQGWLEGTHKLEGYPLDQVQPHHPKENPAVAGGVFCVLRKWRALVGAFYARRRTQTSFPYETENKNGSQLTVRGEPFLFFTYLLRKVGDQPCPD